MKWIAVIVLTFILSGFVMQGCTLMINSEQIIHTKFDNNDSVVIIPFYK